MNASDTVLVIDNDTPTVDLIAEFLTDEGYIVRTATNAACALPLALEVQPNLVLCALRMPARDGMAFAEDLRSNGLSDVPIIIMTSDTSAPERLATDGIVFCIKPFALDDLLDCVTTHIHPSGSLAQSFHQL